MRSVCASCSPTMNIRARKRPLPEAEAAFEHRCTTMVEVPNELLPAVRELLGEH
jgi:hypothetical protein